MSTDSNYMILIIVPTAAVVVAVALTAFFVIRKMRRSARTNILPVNEKPDQTFLQNHLSGLRSWEKPPCPPRPSTDHWYGQARKTDPGHLPFLAQPSATPSAESSKKSLTWQQFKERQRQRERDPTRWREGPGPKPEWIHKPKDAAYWHQVAQEQEAQKSWLQRFRDKYGLW
ncbi:hypothetical protein EK21DRAFT_108248 [Setomelanomma holmii]|uniref:Uncharacterized protein n=1 Tax=Setomelanomma holmii TaxID=210430 RepID=A0A9P4HII5_9PLEO|nr:hypothetical protein EK21DRAFT_108248 [Setomelanomma holmii]